MWQIQDNLCNLQERVKYTSICNSSATLSHNTYWLCSALQYSSNTITVNHHMKLHLVTTQEVEKAPTTRVTDSTSSYWLFIFLPAKIVVGTNNWPFPICHGLNFSHTWKKCVFKCQSNVKVDFTSAKTRTMYQMMVYVDQLPADLFQKI
jgi:hypothetical protein